MSATPIATPVTATGLRFDQSPSSLAVIHLAFRMVDHDASHRPFQIQMLTDNDQGSFRSCTHRTPLRPGINIPNALLMATGVHIPFDTSQLPQTSKATA
ncbi:hypothetical protein CVT26_012679 [Gymnopilus dilepis]|uniref:Uncharacterized protein n=1 Tax=Gymnopilus dilepis TaxID=231916 RepID=A0A409WAP5_9AGAR|nr:hypothetical protein CVT26_012679 [Gymnopilus dilepis]